MNTELVSTNLDLEDIFLERDDFVRNELGVDFYRYQELVSNEIIASILMRTGEEIPIEISRQAGKTEALVCTVCFLMTYSKTLTKRFWGEERGIRIIIFAPQKEQAKTDFDRLKLYLNKLRMHKEWADLVDAAESNQTTLQLRNGSYCYIFPLTPTSNPESKSADLIIYEEAHKIIDSEKKNKAEPMGASTNAPEISIGVAWYAKNYFKVLCDQKPDHLRFPAPMVVKHRRAAYNIDGIVRHLLYEQKFRKIVERYGLNDTAVKTQWLLEWLLEAGQFFNPKDWQVLTKPYLWKDGQNDVLVQTRLLDSDRENECFAGLDTAKHPDSTVCTIIRFNKKTQHNELVALLELHGTNYSDQFTIISGFDTVQGKRTGQGMFDYFNVVGLAIDSTGQGSFMPDMFMRHTRFKDERTGLFEVKFSLSSKDVLYTNLEQVILNRLTAIPNDNTLELQKLREQLIDLEKEYKGQFLSVHHPEDQEGQEYHDDYPDSWALAEYAYSMRQRIARPNIRQL